MKDWKLLASALRLEMPEADLARATATLEAMETLLSPLKRDIPLETEPAFVVFCSPEESA